MKPQHLYLCYEGFFVCLVCAPALACCGSVLNKSQNFLRMIITYDNTTKPSIYNVRNRKASTHYTRCSYKSF